MTISIQNLKKYSYQAIASRLCMLVTLWNLVSGYLLIHNMYIVNWKILIGLGFLHYLFFWTFAFITYVAYILIALFRERRSSIKIFKIGNIFIEELTEYSPFTIGLIGSLSFISILKAIFADGKAIFFFLLVVPVILLTMLMTFCVSAIALSLINRNDLIVRLARKQLPTFLSRYFE